MSSKFSLNGLLGSISRLISEEEVVERKPSKNPAQKAHEDEIQNAILVLAAAVIRCNRNFNSDTEKFVHEFFARQFGAYGSSHRTNSINGHIDTGTEPFIKITCKELKMLTTHDSRLTIVQFLFGVADADDFINAKEIRCIHRIAGYLGISDKDFKELKNNFVGENNPYKLLGIEEGATMEQVRVAYRRMVLKFHPDKRSVEVSEEEASIKFREIKRAFEVITAMLK